MYSYIYIYTYADVLSLITPSHPQVASERSFLTNQPQGASLASLARPLSTTIARSPPEDAKV